MKSRSTISGFTLIELIMVIVILSILSLYASSRFIRTGISAVAIQDQVISVVRQVQVNRMQSNVSSAVGNNDFILSIATNCIGSKASCSSQSSSRSDWVEDSSVTFSPVQEVKFDLLGNPTPSSVTISISENNSSQTCTVTINEQGYVSKGGCS
ncbi:type II secretion system protein [Vibrio sp. 1403]|uniref:type II secretion system protein n=1 Tax=Vibrio TaxID=662 RepID=UPI0014284FCF|nr:MULTISPECIES: type II secretion system protein [Vibrio]MBO0199806.1 type II secretion system protein [Vibrio alginolyticus]MBS9994502.1 type II secretion system protein [Vibrio alginolyticus]MCR9310355.1 type II secretion system GspH family protein [Vibrio diabolicus]MDU9595696.1 type II secretion system protein [Vibrio sp. 2-1-2a]MDU9604750.1 type II secretion system protein [Vibrio sp. 1-2-3a]